MRAVAWLGLALVLGAAAFGGFELWQRTGPAPRAPAELAALDPLLQERLEDELARVSLRRRSAAAWLRLGMVFEANALQGDAARAYARALELGPGDARTLLRMACVQERLGDLEAAAQALARAAQAAPERASTWLRLAWWRLDLGRFDEAAQAFERARKLSPDDPLVGLMAARIALEEGRAEDARALLEQGGHLRGRQASFAHHLLSIAHRQAGDFAAAAEAQARSTDQRVAFGDPWDAQVSAFQAGYAALRVRAGRDVLGGRYEAAEEALRQVLAYEPDDLRSLSLLATCRLERGDPTEALELLEAVLRKDPGHFGARLNVALVLLRSKGAEPGALAQAHAGLAAALNERPSDARGWRVLAAVAEALGSPSDVLSALDRAVALDPTATDLRLKAAGLAPPADALVRFRTLFEEAPELLEAGYGEVAALLELGQREEARAALARLSTRPGVSSARLGALRAALEAKD